MIAQVSTCFFKRNIVHIARIFLALAIGILSVCSANAQSQSRDHKVEIKGFIFTPSIIKAKPGDSITWVNRDIAPHTATGSNGNWDTGTISKNESKTILVNSEMDLTYFCQFHPNMKGTVVVESD